VPIDSVLEWALVALQGFGEWGASGLSAIVGRAPTLGCRRVASVGALNPRVAVKNWSVAWGGGSSSATHPR
jgi:hypothetical protein